MYVNPQDTIELLANFIYLSIQPTHDTRLILKQIRIDSGQWINVFGEEHSQKTLKELGAPREDHKIEAVCELRPSNGMDIGTFDLAHKDSHGHEILMNNTIDGTKFDAQTLT